MIKSFIKVCDDRIRISSIKRYKPMEDKKLVIRFSSSTENKQAETFTFETTEKRDAVIDILDLMCF